jgi:hypothetical protein
VPVTVIVCEELADAVAEEEVDDVGVGDGSIYTPQHILRITPHPMSLRESNPHTVTSAQSSPPESFGSPAGHIEFHAEFE